jgi:phage-related baseplate assembly protein
MSLLSLATLITRTTKEQFIEKGLAVATALGLPVTSWAAGDPTRSLYHYLAEVLGDALEPIVVEYIKGAYLDLASSVWRKVLAKQQYNVDVIEATYATTDVVLTNSGGGLYEPGSGTGIGELTVKSTLSGKTYRNTTEGTLAPGPGTTLTLTVVADEPGSASSAGPGEIDDLVTTLLGVTVTNPTAAVGLDDESKENVTDRCRAKLGALSPNGPRDAYRFVALTPSLTGTTNVTRARGFGESTTGDAYLYVASPSGPVTDDDRDAVEAAIIKWATPMCFTPHILSASPVVLDITYEAWLYTTVGQDATTIEAAQVESLGELASKKAIGGDVIPPEIGRLYLSELEAAIKAPYFDYTFRVEITSPAAHIDLLLSQVPVIGTIHATIHLVNP